MKSLQESMERQGVFVPPPHTVSQIVMRAKQLIETNKLNIK